MKTKIFVAGLAICSSIGLSAYTYEVQPLIGQNFTEDGAAVDDSTAFSLRVNKYISPNNAIMFGYTRISDADYNKNIIKKIGKSNRSCGINPCKPTIDPCAQKTNPCATPKVDPCATKTNPCTTNYDNDDNYYYDNDNSSSQSNSDNDYNTDAGNGNSNGSNANNNNSAGSNANNNNGAGSTNQNNANNNQKPHKPTVNKPTHKLTPDNTGSLSKNSKKVSTDVDRFYINGLHNIDLEYSRLKPYVYAGFGYERVDKEYNDYKSQGFFDAGLGLKFGINDKVSLLADLQGIKKFRDNDLDILASLGLGFFFGANQQVAPETTVVAVAPKAEPVREITIIKVKPKTNTSKKKINTVSTTKGNYYIQLAAAFKQDVAEGCHFTEEMDKEGIAYDVKYTTIKGKNASVLVTGPYSSREEAKEELAKIRKISKDAFIRKFKN